MRSAVLAAAWLFAIACDSSVSSSLENKECTTHGECLPGWMCSEDQICVRAAETRNDPQGSASDAGATSGDGAMVTGVGPGPTCDAGTACEGSCVDLQHDLAHCGTCGHRCPNASDGTATCNAGVCELVCNEGYTRCGDECFRLNDHVSHCGSCETSCPSVENGSPACASGMCQKSCNPGFTLCDGACVRVESDAHHCGKCGHACDEGDQCAAGTCVRNCPAGTMECARSCVDPKSDPANCGKCGTKCPAPANAAPVCREGACSFECNPGLTLCGDVCLDAQTDPLNCGKCGTVCPPTAARSHPVCQAGRCGMACNAGFAACEDQCVSPSLLQNSRTTCAVLAMQQDRLMCQGMGQNTTFCANECVNTQTDARHCGGCGRACTGGKSCWASTCLNISF